MPATETLYRMDVYQERKGLSATRKEHETGSLYFSRETRDLAQFESWREYSKELDQHFGRTTKYFVADVEWREIEEGTCLTVNT